MTKSPDGKQKRPGRLRRVVKRIFLSLLIVILALVFVVIPVFFSRIVTGAGTRPMDRQLKSTPADFGAAFQEVEFSTGDGVKISAWYLPSHGKAATIVYSHGLFRSRRELLERAMDLWRLGYGTLLYDSRNHGESGPARTSLGYFERYDAEAAVRYLRETVRTQDSIVLYGVSMGAVADLLAAAETPEVAGVISDSAFLTFDDTVTHHLRLFFHLPRFPLGNELEFLIEHRAQFDGAKLDTEAAVKSIGDRPILFVAGANDRRMPPEIARKLYETSASPKRGLLIVDGPGTEVHGHAYQSSPKAYVDRIVAFLNSIGE